MGTKLKEWMDYHTNIDNRREVFYHMSKTMKYIHKKGYCIKTFNPKQIQIVNTNTLKPIQYNTLIKPKEKNADKMKKEDIYNLAFLQIGIHTDMLNVLTPEFLKEKFDEFIPLLPEDDVPYFRGVIIRRANVYYDDYIDEKNKQEITKLEKETTGANNKITSLQKSKSTAVGRAMVDKDTKKLYSPIDKPEAAFVNFLIFPIIMVILGIVLAIVALFT